MNINEYYLGIAEQILQQSNCKKRNYGAVLVNKFGTLESVGYNRTPGDVKGCKECNRLKVPHNTEYSTCRSVHAEQMCIIKANPEDMEGATLYLYGINADGSNIKDIEPCPICKKLIIESQISKVIASSCAGVIKEYKVSKWIEEMNND